MKLNPQQAPLYGDCLLTVQLADEEMSEEQEENGVEFYLLFSGSSQRHLTTTQRVSHATLQAVCPAHNVCESVQVTLCSARPRGPVGPLSEESFHYVQDLALDLARFLLSAAGAPDGPEGALLQDECQVGLKECERLDRSLTLALGHHTLPPGWSVLGAPARPDREEEAADLENGTDVTPRDTLLHFAARRGLRQVAVFLLRQPGGREALRVPNRQGSTPGCLARAKGHLHLLELLQQAESSPDALGRREQQQLLPGGRALQHHPALGTYTLTVASGGQAEEERRAGAAERRGHIQGEVEELRRLIQQHREHKESQAYRDGLSQTHVHSQPSSNHGVEAWTCSNGEPRSQDGARLSGPALGDCGKPRDTLGSSWSAVVGQEEEEPASVTVSSCQAGSDPHQVDKEEIKPVGPCQSLSTATTETIKTTCSAVPITSSGTTLPRNVGVSVQKHKRKAGKSRAAVIAADRKQEEVLALNSCKTDRQAEETKTPSERLPERQRRKAETSPERAPQRTQETEVTLDPTAAMGQTQARDHDQDTGEQTPTDAGTNSPSLERNSSPNPATDAHREGKRRRVLWRDGGWHESNAPRREASPSSTIWYDEAASDTQLASETSRLSLGSSDASPGPPLLLCGATDPSPALAVALGAGSPPALSHGAAQRQEAHAPPQEEGQWEEVAEREGRERADSGEREESEDRGERGGKGKRRKRRKKGKRAGAESKPSSSFDTDTQADLEVQTEDRAESQGESGRSRTSLRSDSSTESETRTSLPASVMRLAPCMAEDETGASGPGVTPEPGQANSRAPGSSDTVGATETAGHGESREATEPVGDFTFEESLESSKLKESEESIAPVELTECIDQSVSASECKELVNEARDKRTDVSARQKKEGTAEVGEKYFEQCLSIESEGGGKDNLELKTTDWRSEEGRTEERRLEDTRKEERSYKEELAATAVAVVTVAIAGAIATIELKELLCSKLLNQSDSTHKAECSITVPPGLESKAPAQSVSQLAAQAVNQLPTQPVSQLATQSVSQLAAQAVNQLPTQPVSQLATLSVSQLAAQAVNQLPTQPVNQLPTQPVSHVEAQYVNQLPGQAVSQLPAQSVSQLPAQSVSKLAALSVSQLPAQSVSKLAALPLTQLAAQSVCPPPAQSDSVATAQATTKLLEQSDSISPTQSVGELTDHPDSLPITQSAIQPPPQSNSIFTAHSDSIPIAQSSSIPTAQSGSSPAKRSDCLPTVITASQAPAEPDRVVFGQSARQPVAQPRGPFTHQSDSPPPAPSAATEGSAATGGGLPADRDPEARPEKPLGHLDGVRGAEQPQDEEGLHWTAGQTTAPQGPLPQAASLPAGAGQGITGGNMEAPPGEHQPGSKPGSAAHAQEAASVGQATVNSPTDTGTDTGTYQEGAIDHPGLITLSAGPSACEIARNHDNGATHLSLGLSLPTHTEMEGGTVQHPDRTSPLDVTSGWSGALPPSHAVERAGGETERRTLGAGGSPRDSGGREPPASLTPGEPLPQIHKDKDTVGPLPACPGPGLDPAPQPQLKGSRTLAPCPDIVEECVSLCGSEVDGLVSPELGDDCVFKKASESVSGVSDSTSGAYASCSSMDDTSSLGPLSTSSPSSQGACWSATSEASGTSSSGNPWTTEQTGEGGAGGGEGVGAGGEEEERKDKLTENPVLRSSIRSLSPLRRHSWGPGKIPAGETDLSQRSSLKSATAEVKRVKAPCHRRSMSWSTSNLPPPDQQSVDNRSYSLEGLSAEGADGRAPCPSLGASDGAERCTGRGVRLDSEERGSLVSLTEEEQEGELGGAGSVDSQQQQLIRVLASRHSCPSIPPPAALTKSVSMVTISQRELDVIGRPRPKRRISFSLSISPLIPKSRTFFSIGSHSSDDEEGVRVGSFSSTSGSVDYSISEEEQPGPLRSDSEGRGGTKVSRTFSYLKSKMSKKTKEKDKDKEKSREKEREKDRESREKERKPVNGHVFNPVSPVMAALCPACSRPLSPKDAFLCNNCGAHVHKSCRESVPVCAKVKMKPMTVVDGGLGSSSNTRSKCLPPPSALPSTGRERPWSVMVTPEEQGAVVVPRRKPSLHLYHSNLAKSMSISNIAGPLADDGPATLKKYLSQSTDSLNQNPKVNASTESLTDEGTDMMDSQLMGEFEGEVRQLEADSWSFAMDKKFVKLQKKEVVKRQDVIYELYQTEMHHVRTLRIMSEVYSKGLQKELQLDPATLEKVFPVLEELLALHSLFLSSLLERKRASLVEGREDGSFLIRRLGDVLVAQFSGSHAEQMKKVYGKFCSRHSDAVNLYKELHAKDKRFQAFTKRKMSSSIVRRLSIPECILLVTQRITKYPVLLQRILQHTKETDEDHGAVAEALRCVKLLIAAVDSKVNEQEKKRRLREVHRRTDSKSITRMKSGQMFAREDLVRGGRKLLHDGALQLKNATGRLKDVQAMLLSDVFVFLQEKDQKYSFASLDQRSTVLSLQKLIVREVANEERGLFLITAGTDRPEMVEVLASSKEERNTWMSIIQDAMHSMEKEEDEGVPSETEEDRRQQESRAREIREFLRKKDDEIVSLLEDKVHIFRELCTSSPSDSSSPPIRERMLFRATPDDVTKGEPIMKDALKEVESLHVLVNGGLGAGACSNQEQPLGGGVGPVCLPRRAETFGGFDSHQMNNCKNGEKEEGDESVDLRRTESDGVLKKGAPASLQLLLKRNNEVVHSVLHLHELLTALQAVVLQQDSFIEEQRQALSERPASRHSSSSSLSSATSSSRPNSLIEQEKQRSAERQRQEAASLHKQQAAHAEERRRREREWEAKEESLAQREERVRADEEEERRRRRDMEEEREELLAKKEEYQRDLERLRETQRRLERDREVLRKETERMEAMRRAEPEQLQRYQRTPSTTSEDSLRFHDSGSLDEEPKEPPEVILSSSAPTKEPFLRIGSKRMGKNFNPFSSSSSSSKPTGGEGPSQMPSRLMQLAKPKEKKDKKKKKGKGEHLSQPDPQGSAPHTDGDIFFC